MLMIKKLNCIPHSLARLSSSPRLASPAGKFEGQTLATSSVLARGCTRCPSLPYSAQTSRPSEIDSVLSELGFCETLALQLLTSPAFRPDLLRAPTRNVSVQFMSALRPPTPPCRRGQLARWPGKRTLTSVEGSFRLSISPSDATAVGAHHAAHVAGASKKGTAAAFHDLQLSVLADQRESIERPTRREGVEWRTEMQGCRAGNFE